MSAPDLLPVTEHAPYALPQPEKQARLLPALNALTAFHAEHCAPYGRFVRGEQLPADRVEQVPYLPVSAFKHYELRSVGDEELARVVLSSATTSGKPSKVYIDKATAAAQRTTVHRILSDYIGSEPRTYVIFDDPKTASGRGALSARGAALMSLMSHASKFFFVVRATGDELELDSTRIEEAVDHARKTGAFLAYGFTWLLWRAHRQLRELGLDLSGPWDPNRTFLLHSGGWKRLVAEAVDKDTFNRTVAATWAVPAHNVIDFYGMAEQVGVIYPDCPAGNKHVPHFAEVIVRNPRTLEPAAVGEPGLVQLLSVLGRGGPSHSVITEDLGVIVHVDDCPCGRRGKAFRLLGRVEKAETRGCGDVYGR